MVGIYSTYLSVILQPPLACTTHTTHNTQNIKNTNTIIPPSRQLPVASISKVSAIVIYLQLHMTHATRQCNFIMWDWLIVYFRGNRWNELTFNFWLSLYNTQDFLFLHILTILWPVSMSHLKFWMGPIIHTWVCVSYDYHTNC